MTAVVFKFQTPEGDPVVGAPFTVALRKASFDETTEAGILLPGVIDGVTDAQGMCTLELAPGFGVYYLTMAAPDAVEDSEGCISGLRYKFVVPEGLVTARVETLIVTTPTWSRPWDEQALAIITEAKASALSSALRAETAAQTIEGDAARAEAAAVIAVDSKNAAGASADTAGLLAEQARVLAVNSGNSANAASSSATAALDSENAAEQYAADAATAGAQAGTTAANAVVANKVDKEVGKGLSTNDYDNVEKAKVTAAIPNTQKGVASGVATLGADAKIPVSQLPPLAINEVFTVASQAEMLALTAERGDMAIRSDQNQAYVLATDAPTVLANWIQIKQNLGVALTALAGNVPGTDTQPFYNGSATATTTPFTAKARALQARTDAAGMQAELGLVPVTSSTDNTNGRLVTSGWMGLGTPIVMQPTDSADTLSPVTARFLFGAGGLNIPYNFVYLDQFAYGSGSWVRQVAYAVNGHGIWERFFSAGAAAGAAWTPIVVGEKVSSNLDTVPGHLVTVGYCGLGAKDNNVHNGNNLNPTDYRTGGSFFGQWLLDGIGSVVGVLTVYPTSDPQWLGQVIINLNSGALFTRSQDGAAGGVFTAWRRTYNDSNSLNDPQTGGGLMSATAVSGWTIEKFANGTMIYSGVFSTVLLAANAISGVNITIPSGFVNEDYIIPYVSCLARLDANFYAPNCYVSGTSLVVALRNGPTAQIFDLRIKIIGRWKA